MIGAGSRGSATGRLLVYGHRLSLNFDTSIVKLRRQIAVVNLDCRQDGAAFDPSWGRASYLFNSTIAGIESASCGVAGTEALSVTLGRYNRMPLPWSRLSEI